MRAFIQILPSEPVKIGDSWDSGIEIENLQDSEINLKNTWKNYENDKVIIVSAYKKDIDDKPIKNKNNPNMIFKTIDYVGFAHIEKSNGWIIRKDVNMIFSAEIKQQGTTIPMSVNITKIIEPVKSTTNPLKKYMFIK